MTTGDSLPSHDAKNKAASRRRNLALFVLGLVTLPSCQAMLLVYGIRIREYFAINAEQFGTLFGSRGLGRIPALLTIGPLLARMGVRRVTELATVGIGIGFLILGVGGTLAAFRVSMPVMGFFLGLSGIAIPAFLISLFPDRKRRIFSVMLVASAAPSILTPLLANELLKWSNERGDAAFATVILQTPFVICGGALLLGGLLLSLAKLKESRAELERPHRIRIGQLLHLRSLAIVLMLSLHAAADTTLYTFLPMFMASQFKHLPLPPAAAVAGHGVAYVATRTLLSFWPEGKWHRGILCLAGPLGGTVIILTLWFGPAVSVPLLYTLASMMFAAEYPVLVSEVSSESMAEFGSIVAGGMLVSEFISFALLKGTGRLADLTGDFRLATQRGGLRFPGFRPDRRPDRSGQTDPGRATFQFLARLRVRPTSSKKSYPRRELLIADF